MKNTIFVESMKVYAKKKEYFLKILVLDIVFVAALLIVAWIFNRIQPADVNLFIANLGGRGPALTFAIAFALIYTLIILLVYSFFKFLVLGRIRDVRGKPHFDMKGLPQFYFLNLMIVFTWLVVFSFLSWAISSLIGPTYVDTFSSILSFVAVVAIYAMINISHFIFEHDLHAWHVFKEGLRVLFTRIKLWYSPFVVAAVAYAIYRLALIIISWLVNVIAQPPYFALRAHPGYYIPVTVVGVLLIYLTISFNRLYFQILLSKPKKL